MSGANLHAATKQMWEPSFVVAGAAAQRTSRLRHAVIAQLLAVSLLCAAIAWQPGETVLAGGGNVDTPGEEFVRVTVPPNAHAGDMLQVAVAGRREREVAIPAGAQPGQVLSFAIPVPAPAVPSTKKAAPARAAKEREIVDVTRKAYRHEVQKSASAAQPKAAAAPPHAVPPEATPELTIPTLSSAKLLKTPGNAALQDGEDSKLEAKGDDFAPLIGAIKKVMAASSSEDPNAAAESTKALKDAVEGIVAAKIMDAKQKDAAEAAAMKQKESQNVAKKLGRLLGERMAAEDAKVKTAEAAQKAAEEAEAEAEADAKKAKEQKSEEEATAAASAAATSETDAAEGDLEKDEADAAASAGAAKDETDTAERELSKDEENADNAAATAETDEERSRDFTEQEEQIAADANRSEDAAKKAEEAVSAAAAAETEEAKSARDDADAAETARDIANSAADKAVEAKDKAEKSAGDEEEAATKNMASAKERAAVELAKENEIVEAARQAYRKALGEADVAQESEDTANRDVDRMRAEEEKTMSQADTAASEAEHERDAAETERFDAENAAKKSSIAEAQAKDERDEAKMERQRAEKAAQDAYTNGITSNSAEWRIEAQIDSYRDSERKAIEENDKELKEAIENAQEQIAKAQEKMEDKADKDKDSAKNAVRKAMRSASSDFTREVKGVKHMVRQLRREFDKKPSTPSYAAPPYVTPPYAATPYAASPYAAPPYAALSYGTPPWPYSPVYGGAVAGAGVYHQGRWQDKAIFLQRELNDMQAERGLYERRLAVTAATLGSAKRLGSATQVSLRARAVGVTGQTPWAGTAIPLAAAIPLALPTVSSYGGYGGYPSVFSVGYTRENAPMSSSGGYVGEMPVVSQGEQPTVTTVEEPMVSVAQPAFGSMLAGAHGQEQALNAQEGMQQMLQQQKQQTQQEQMQLLERYHVPAGAKTRVMSLQAGKSYTMQA